MNESQYRNDVFLVEMASLHLARLISENADPDRIEEARNRLAKYRQQLEDALANATPKERRHIFHKLADSHRDLG